MRYVGYVFFLILLKKSDFCDEYLNNVVFIILVVMVDLVKSRNIVLDDIESLISDIYNNVNDLVFRFIYYEGF